MRPAAGIEAVEQEDRADTADDQEARPQQLAQQIQHDLHRAFEKATGPAEQAGGQVEELGQAVERRHVPQHEVIQRVVLDHGFVHDVAARTDVAQQVALDGSVVAGWPEVQPGMVLGTRTAEPHGERHLAALKRVESGKNVMGADVLHQRALPSSQLWVER